MILSSLYSHHHKHSRLYHYLYIMSDGLGSKRRSSDNASSFEAFFEGWLVRQEHYLDELLSAQHNTHESGYDYLEDLISRVLAHYRQYYDEKSGAAQRNVFLVFSPKWFSSFEQTFFWIGGFRPDLVFGLVVNSVGDLSEEQSRRMSRLREETKAAERELADELARIQESVAAPPLLEAARRVGRGVGAGIEGMDAAVDKVRLAMEAVLVSADSLRTSTAARVVEILSPPQNVRFLAAATQLQLRIRSWGLQKDAEREANNEW